MLKNICCVILFGLNGETQLGGATWFLRVLFFITVFFYFVQFLLKRMCKNNYEKISLWTQFILSALLLTIGWGGHVNNWSVTNNIANKYQYFTCASIYFVYIMGWLFAKTGVIDCLNNIYVSFITVIICFMVLRLVTPEAAVGINANNYASISHLVVSSLFGIIYCVALTRIIKKISGLRKIFEVLGRYSLYIMMLHFFAFKVVTFGEVIYYKFPPYYLASYPVLITDGVWRLLYIIIGCGLPVLFVYVLKNSVRELMRVKKIVCRGD